MALRRASSPADLVLSCTNTLAALGRALSRSSSSDQHSECLEMPLQRARVASEREPKVCPSLLFRLWRNIHNIQFTVLTL